jgi:hypothetical protein
MTESELEQMIFDAFPKGKSPPVGKVAGICHRPEEIECGFQGKRWEEISPDQIRRYYDALAHMTDNAFVYYLPAYLRAIPSTDGGHALLWNLVLAIHPPLPYLDKDEYQLTIQTHRLERLSDKQKAVVACALQFFPGDYLDDWDSEWADGPHHRDTLEYWSQFRPHG